MIDGLESEKKVNLNLDRRITIRYKGNPIYRLWWFIRDKTLMPVKRLFIRSLPSGTTKDVFETMTRPNEYARANKLLPSYARYHWNVIYENSSAKEYRARFRRVHMWFKYLILEPGLIIIKKVLGTHLVKEVPKKTYNKNFLIFDEAFEKTLREWVWFYQRNANNPDDVKEFTKDMIDKQMKKGKIIGMIRTMKEMIYTVCMNDTAFREMFNMFCYNLTIGMNKSHGSKAQHVLYKGEKIDDKAYYYVHQKTGEEGKEELLIQELLREMDYRKRQMEEEIKNEKK